MNNFFVSVFRFAKEREPKFCIGHPHKPRKIFSSKNNPKYALEVTTTCE